MGYRKLSASSLAILFCLAVVRRYFGGHVPTLTEAAEQLGVSRELAPRLYGRLYDQLLGLIERHQRPGPRAVDGESEVQRKSLAVTEALLGVARAVICAAGIAVFSPERREEIVVAVERLKVEHGVGYEQAAARLGLCSRTLRTWRGEMAAGNSLAPKSRAPKNPHGKLPEALARDIADYVALFPDEPLAKLHRQFVRDNAELCKENGHPELSYGAFCRASGRSKNKPEEARTKPERGRDAPENLPYRALALMDTTDLACFGFDFKLIPLMEAHSRAIFAHELCERERAEKVAQVLEQGVQAGGVLAVRVDRGTPYLAELTVRAVEEQGAQMRVARAYRPTDKALIERFFLTLKRAVGDVLGCIDLRGGPGELTWRKKLAQTLGSAVVSLFLRWCYPYIPQPHIDGRCPQERTLDATPSSQDAIHAALDERARHHEHARTVARELHRDYDFRWSMKRWLQACKPFRADDLREAARRFDRILLRGCFGCDPKRNPKYLLAIARTVREERRPQQQAERRERLWNQEQSAARQAAQDRQRMRAEQPELAASQAIDLARMALRSKGFGLKTATRRLDQALGAMAARGPDAYRLTTRCLAEKEENQRVLTWMLERIESARPPPRPLKEDLLL
jgi:transposase InsO family protein